MVPAGWLARPLFESRKDLVDPRKRLLAVLDRLARVSAEQQVLLDGHPRKEGSPLWHLYDAALDEGRRVEAVDPLPVEPDRPLADGKKATDRPRRRGLPDAWLPNPIPLSSMDQLREHVDRGAEKQDRDPAEVETIPFATTCVFEDGEQARTRASEENAHYIGAMGDYTRESLTHLGFGDVATEVDELWADGETDAAVDAISDELLDEITVSGTPEQAAATLDRYGDETDGLVILPAKAATESEIRRTIDHVGELADGR